MNCEFVPVIFAKIRNGTKSGTLRSNVGPRPLAHEFFQSVIAYATQSMFYHSVIKLCFGCGFFPQRHFSGLLNTPFLLLRMNVKSTQIFKNFLLILRASYLRLLLQCYFFQTSCIYELNTTQHGYYLSQ